MGGGALPPWVGSAQEVDMRRVSIAVVLTLAMAVAVVMLSATSADEGTLKLRASLNGFQEVPPKLTDGAGTFTATINGGTLHYTLTYSNLSSTVLQAHIHFGQKAVSGGIFIWLCQTATNPSPTSTTPMCPEPGGTVSGTVTAADVQKVTGQTLRGGNFNDAIAIIRSGEAYANVHTTNFPGGEIRGQVSVESD
jgi:CHRD domain